MEGGKKMTLGERLLQYRTDLKISQDALAEKVGVTRQTVSKWETDQSTPEFNKILPLCEIFGITPNELIKGEKEETVEQKEKIQEEQVEQEIIKRNRKKATIVSISVFLYIISIFAVAYMEESLQYDDGKTVMFLGITWSIATVLLIHFFIANPKEKLNKKQEQIIKEEKRANNKLEKYVLELITLIFLLIYLGVSFITMAWHITWILWVVYGIVEAIVKIIFSLKNGEEKKHVE